MRATPGGTLPASHAATGRRLGISRQAVAQRAARGRLDVNVARALDAEERAARVLLVRCRLAFVRLASQGSTVALAHLARSPGGVGLGLPVVAHVTLR